MKVLGWHVTFVRRISLIVVILRYTYVDMKVWSRMFAVNVQCVSAQLEAWNSICQYTRLSDNFAAVYVTKVSNILHQLNNILRNVVMLSEFYFVLFLALVVMLWIVFLLIIIFKWLSASSLSLCCFHGKYVHLYNSQHQLCWFECVHDVKLDHK